MCHAVLKESWRLICSLDLSFIPAETSSANSDSSSPPIHRDCNFENKRSNSKQMRLLLQYSALFPRICEFEFNAVHFEASDFGIAQMSSDHSHHYIRTNARTKHSPLHICLLPAVSFVECVKE